MTESIGLEIRGWTRWYCIDKDWKKLTSFFDFPSLHWRGIRTSNPIESAFSTVKLRTSVTRGAGSTTMATTIAYKLLKESEKRWTPIRGREEIRNILQGVLYIDGELSVKEFNQQVVA